MFVDYHLHAVLSNSGHWPNVRGRPICQSVEAPARDVFREQRPRADIVLCGEECDYRIWLGVRAGTPFGPVM